MDLPSATSNLPTSSSLPHSLREAAAAGGSLAGAGTAGGEEYNPYIPYIYTSSTHSHIRLNIGGVLFCTSLSTLLRVQPSFFSSLFSRWHNLANKAPVFIDRDPTYFQLILNFLRNGELDVFRTLNLNQKRAVLMEAKFYGVCFERERGIRWRERERDCDVLMVMFSCLYLSLSLYS